MVVFTFSSAEPGADVPPTAMWPRPARVPSPRLTVMLDRELAVGLTIPQPRG